MAQHNSTKTEFDDFLVALEETLGGFSQSVIGVAGVFGREKTQSLARILTQSVAREHALTSVYVPITRADIVDVPGDLDASAWDRIRLVSKQFNTWPNKPENATTRYQIDSLQCLRWLRRESEFAVVTFDTLEQVMDRVALARRLDGLIIVNSGAEFELSVMSAAADQLVSDGVRLLGQVRRTGLAT